MKPAELVHVQTAWIVNVEIVDHAGEVVLGRAQLIEQSGRVIRRRETGEIIKQKGSALLHFLMRRLVFLQETHQECGGVAFGQLAQQPRHKFRIPSPPTLLAGRFAER